MAVLGFTEFIDAEYVSKGIIAFTVHPGNVTNMGLRLPEDAHDLMVGKAELCGDALVWMTKERIEWMAGRYVAVDWELDELEARKGEIVEGDKLKVRLVV